MDKELKNDLIASWNEIDEALIDLEELGLKDLIKVLPTIKDRLNNAHYWLGKYVSSGDVLQFLE